VLLSKMHPGVHHILLIGFSSSSLIAWRWLLTALCVSSNIMIAESGAGFGEGVAVRRTGKRRMVESLKSMVNLLIERVPRSTLRLLLLGGCRI
jgi:hypothetical protein